MVTSNSKRAYLNRRSLILNATADSEGSLRYTVDANAGNRLFAVRLNAVKGDTKYFRPNISQATEGLHVTATLRPWKWLEVRGEYRDYRRDSILAQAVIVRAPLALLLPTGERVDNQNSRYLAAFPESRNLTDGKFDLTTVDSAIGPYRRDAYFNELKSVVAEATSPRVSLSSCATATMPASTRALTPAQRAFSPRAPQAISTPIPPPAPSAPNGP